MKKQISNIFRFFLIMIFAVALASCSFWNDSIEEKESTTTTFVPGGLAGSKGTFTVSGTIGISEGAFPSSLVNAVNDKRSSRAAMPQIPASLTYSVIASDGTNEVTGTKSGNDYQMTLECGKAWTVSVIAKDDYEMPVYSDTWTIPADNTEANLSHNFYVKPAASASGTGTLALTIVLNNDLDGLFSKVTADCKSVANMDDWEVLISPDEDITFPADSSVSISISDDTIASGQYEVSFNFYNDSNVLVYNTVQTINIFDNLTTNTWVSGNSSGPIKSDGTFELTKALVDGYARTHLYVGETNFTAAKADDYNGNGTAAKPFASVTGAINYLKKVGSAEQDYTIYVVGTVAGAQVIKDDLTYDGNGNETVTTIPAKSITLEGFKGLNNGVPQDTLNGGFDEDNEGQTLLISTSIPVTIKNLTITGGYQFNNYGAGISVSGDSKVYLEDGTLITGNHSEAAGAAIGIIDSATVTMNGGVIENNASKYEFEGTDFSGTVVIFKEDRSEEGTPKFIMNGGTIKKNTTFFYGGGVGVVLDGVFEMNGGTIGGTSEEDANIADTDGTSSENARSTYGGGVYVGDGGSFVMTGGLIANNKAIGIGTDPQENHQYMNCGGGGVAVCEGGSFEMKAGETTTGTISSNTSARNGGGVYIDSSSTFIMTDGTISGNTSTDEGKGVYLNSSSSVFKMGGSAYLDSNNDIYLPTGATIAITANFIGDYKKSNPAATITPAAYSNTPILVADLNDETGDPLVNLETEYDVFFISPQIVGEDPDTKTVYWEIHADGILYIVSSLYVSSSGDNLNSGLDDENPLETLEEAFKRMNSSSTDYVINVLDSLGQSNFSSEYKLELTDDINGTAQSITLRGVSEAGEEKKDLNGGSDGDPVTVMKVTTTVPIKIENLIIKGGCASGTSALGGGIYIGPESTVILGEGACVNGGSDYTGKGGGVYVDAVEVEGDLKAGTLIMKEDAVVNADEYGEIYLCDGAKIKIATALTGESLIYDYNEDDYVPSSIVARITPQTYTAGTEVIGLTTDVTAGLSLSDIIGNVCVSDNVIDVDGNEVTIAWKVNSLGQLATVISVGDLLLSDGTFVAYDAERTSFATELEGEKNPVGVVYALDENYAPRGVIGIKNSPPISGEKKWSNNNTSIPNIVCTPSGNDANLATFTGDVDGSDNWNEMGNANSSAYPIFDYALKYGTETETDLSETSYSSGWYVPSIAEQCYIYRNLTVINNVLNILKTDYSSATRLSTGDYWSSSQNEESADEAWYINFSSGLLATDPKSDEFGVCVIHVLEVN